MGQQAAANRVRSPIYEAQQNQWCGIGINAVAAASIYCEKKDRPKGTPENGVTFAYRQPDFATD